MSLTSFYRAQADQHEATAAAAPLENVRDRSRRAAAAWTKLAKQSEAADTTRADAAFAKMNAELDENPDRGSANE